MSHNPGCVVVPSRSSSALVAGLFAALVGSVAVAAETFSEGTFDPGSFSSVVVQGGLGGASMLIQDPNGGNPGPYLLVQHTLPAGAPSGGFCANWVWSFVFIDGASVDPGALGGIVAVDFALDSKPTGGTAPLIVQSQLPALRQDGRIYIGIGGTGVTPTVPGWSTTAIANLGAASFFEMINAPPCDFTGPGHPDFSPGGALIELGFARGNSTAFGGNAEPYSVMIGADAWSMTVHTCVADLSQDGSVDGADLGLLLANWGNAGAGDLDGNGAVDGADLGVLLSAWGPCPVGP